MKIFSALVTLSFLIVGLSAQATFLPENDLSKFDSIQGFDATTMTEVEFNQIIEKVYSAMAPSIALHNATMEVKRLWTNATVNANSGQTGNKWVINMYGGLARRPEITHDGFALVMCHEMGHHLGGFPFYPFLGRWAAAEGQADYFATEVCAKKVFGDDKVENAKARFTVTSFIKDHCDKIYSDPDTQNLCYRIAGAAQSLGNMLTVLNKQDVPKFETPDATTVPRTNPSYPPKSQCRLDTYLQGLLCTAKFDMKVIPGRRGFGIQGNIDGEKEAAQYACTKSTGFAIGMRPACWYKDRLSN